MSFQVNPRDPFGRKQKMAQLAQIKAEQDRRFQEFLRQDYKKKLKAADVLHDLMREREK